LVNLGGGTYEGAITLINEAKKSVFEQFGIELELEIEIVARH
jgi:UDP-N-acetylmuramate dehydrogenase